MFLVDQITDGSVKKLKTDESMQSPAIYTHETETPQSSMVGSSKSILSLSNEERLADLNDAGDDGKRDCIDDDYDDDFEEEGENEEDDSSGIEDNSDEGNVMITLII